MTGRENKRRIRSSPKNRHIIEVAGARVIIDDGVVTDIGEPKVNYCPLYDKLHGVKVITKDFIRSMVEKNIKNYGMFTEYSFRA